MKKILFVSAGVLLLLASCSKSETVDVNRDGDEISFNIVANNATKAADIYCNNNLPSQFSVYAMSEGKTYIDGDLIVNKGENSWENQSGTRFWPDAPVDFYAHVNAGNYFKWTPASEDGTAPASIVDFEVPTDVTAQNDLLYAVKKNQSKAVNAESQSPVELNFRHALSQIVFNAKNTNANLYVEISGVRIMNVGNVNTFAFPTADTDNNIADADHDGSLSYTINYEDGSWGKWDGLTGGSAIYPVELGDNIVVEGNNALVDLTTNATANNEYNGKALLLLPQATTAWNPETVANPGYEGNESNGTYFLVNCTIYNVSGESFDESVDVPLWGTVTEHKEVAIPAAFNWEQGKKYTYTFVFGKGGGYNPDPDDPQPEPVLVPITFEVTVDDFVEVPSTDIDAEVPESGN